jgi:hypothetical protein
MSRVTVLFISLLSRVPKYRTEVPNAYVIRACVFARVCARDVYAMQFPSAPSARKTEPRVHLCHEATPDFPSAARRRRVPIKLTPLLPRSRDAFPMIGTGIIGRSTLSPRSHRAVYGVRVYQQLFYRLRE